MGRVTFILAALWSVVPATALAADATEPPVAAPPAAEPPAVVVEAPVASPPSAPAPVSVTPVASIAVPPLAAVGMTAAPPTRRPKRETHGLGLAAGFGMTYGLLGLQARYDFPINRWLTVSPFVSGGLLFGWRSGPVGVSAALGARHRFVADLGVAPLDEWRFSLHGTTIEEGTIFGPLLAAGYEHMSDGGWYQRATIELGYTAWSAAPLPITSYPILFTGAGFGRRIW